MVLQQVLTLVTLVRFQVGLFFIYSIQCDNQEKRVIRLNTYNYLPIVQRLIPQTLTLKILVQFQMG
ncbi:hypothetical protein pb186bvf_006573 [Paramecium bursaria]